MVTGRGTRRRFRQRLGSALLVLTMAAGLAACGGGGGGSTAPVDGGGGGGNGGGGTVGTGQDPGTATDCSVAGQQAWLDAYIDSWYYWYALAPRPAASGFADVDSFFRARLYTGTNSRWPADRWSGSESTESFNRFYGDGASMGYGLAVAGLEVAGTLQPLFVRSVEPLSPAGLQGVQRGDEVLQVNGRPAAELTQANDFAALSAEQAGDRLVLRLRREGAERELTLQAAVFNLSPVAGGAVYTTAGGRRVGYLRVQNMITQAMPDVRARFSDLRAQGVQDLVLDLRYNGGGLVSVGAELASLVAGARANGQIYSSLVYNDRWAAANNQDFRFSLPSQALGLQRVLVLAGRRTCSASEQLVNGLRGVGVEVVLIGETTCGKPVGFLPRAACGRTYSLVNFESLNQLRQGDYYDGFAATCNVAEDFSQPQADAARDPLLAAALGYVQTGACPAAAAGANRARALAASRTLRGRAVAEPGERHDMIPR